MTAIVYRYFDSPLGRLFLQGAEEFLTGLYLPQHRGWRGPDGSWRAADSPFVAACEQLEQYFAGERRRFDLPVRVAGTSFQQRVWRELSLIPFGATITYAELARRIGAPTASRAVGAANGRNPISIVVPCHRVIGTDGNLSGYAGGVEKKRWLIDWERRQADNQTRFPFEDATTSVASPDRFAPSEAVTVARETRSA